MDLDAKGKEGDNDEWGDYTSWKPILEFQNNVDISPQLDDGGSFYIRNSYSKYGVVNWYQRYKGNLFLKHDLRDFPFDRQVFRIKFGATLWSANDCHLRDITPPPTKALFSEGMNFSEWELVSDPDIIESVEESIEDHRPISYLEVNFNIRRKSSYYLTHVVLLVFLLNMMSWTVFTLGDAASDRINMNITLFLALVALNFVVVGFIPKVSYSTTLSNYFVVSYALLTLGTLQHVAIYFINGYHCTPDGDPNFPTIPPAIPRCWTALYFDWAVICIYSLTTTLFTIIFVINGQKSRPGEIVHELHSQKPHPPLQPKLSIYTQ